MKLVVPKHVYLVCKSCKSVLFHSIIGLKLRERERIKDIDSSTYDSSTSTQISTNIRKYIFMSLWLHTTKWMSHLCERQTLDRVQTISGNVWVSGFVSRDPCTAALTQFSNCGHGETPGLLEDSLRGPERKPDFSFRRNMIM